MKSLIITAIAAYCLGQFAWAYPTADGVSFGFADFGYHHSFNN
jgi:hypothetical protein